MLVLIDNLVAMTQPDFITYLRKRDPGFSVRVFDPFLTPVDLVSIFQTHQPDVVLFDSAWLVASSMISTLLSVSGCKSSQKVLASSQVNDVLKIRAAHHGYFDILSLQDSMEDKYEQMQLISANVSRLANDPLWLKVSRPEIECDLSAVPRDQTDLDILQLICIGVKDSDIAEVVFLSLQSVRNRVSNMLLRASLSNRTQLASMFTSQLMVSGMMQNLNAQQLKKTAP